MATWQTPCNEIAALASADSRQLWHFLQCSRCSPSRHALAPSAYTIHASQLAGAVVLRLSYLLVRLSCLNIMINKYKFRRRLARLSPQDWKQSCPAHPLNAGGPYSKAYFEAKALHMRVVSKISHAVSITR